MQYHRHQVSSSSSISDDHDVDQSHPFHSDSTLSSRPFWHHRHFSRIPSYPGQDAVDMTELRPSVRPVSPVSPVSLVDDTPQSGEHSPLRADISTNRGLTLHPLSIFTDSPRWPSPTIDDSDDSSRTTLVDQPFRHEFDLANGRHDGMRWSQQTLPLTAPSPNRETFFGSNTSWTNSSPYSLASWARPAQSNSYKPIPRKPVPQRRLQDITADLSRKEDPDPNVVSANQDPQSWRLTTGWGS